VPVPTSGYGVDQMPCKCRRHKLNSVERVRLEDANGLLMVSKDALDEASMHSFGYGAYGTPCAAPRRKL
jgi:hypothetical protein